MPKGNGIGNVVQHYPIKSIHFALICTTGIANTKGSALVIPLLPPRARERGAEKLPHAHRPRLVTGMRSRIRSARASVRRNGGAVPTSRERGP